MKNYNKPIVNKAQKSVAVESYMASGHRTKCNSAAKHTILHA